MDPTRIPPFDSLRMPVLGSGGMVAASQPLAVAAGLRMLDRGGSACDAAVAAAAALAVTEPCSTGLGGDCFMLHYDAARRAVTAMNGSGRAPAALTLERVRADGLGDEERIPWSHAHAVTVPGACAGWHDALERHGALPLAEVLAPAVELAERGFPVAPWAAAQWFVGARIQLERQPGGHQLLVDGRAPRAGERFRNPDLARILRGIAEGGKKAFYEGAAARAIAAAVRAAGGVLDEADLAAHETTWEPPISSVYRGLRVWECAPNGQGLAALLALNLVEGFELAGGDALGPERLHLLIEAMRLAFADARRYVADPDHAAVPVEELLSKAYAAERRREIDLARANPDPRHGRPLGRSDTVYLCAVDAAGNACSFINSNFWIFGTGIVPEGCGFPLQNRGSGFSLDPAHPNALAPGKRPYHTIVPALLTREADASLYGPLGVMGGAMQPQGHLQVVCALVDDGLDPQRALDRPRFCLRDGVPAGEVYVEAGIPTATLDALAARGHRPIPTDGFARFVFGKGQVIRREPDGTLWGGGDPRGDGYPGVTLPPAAAGR